MRRMIGYRGSKLKSTKTILEYFPKNIKSICSPFFGGGGLEINASNLGIYIYAYDLNDLLINFWNCLFNDKDRFLSILKKVHLPTNKNDFFELNNKVSKDNYENAVYFYIISQMSYSKFYYAGHCNYHLKKITRDFLIDNINSFKKGNILLSKLDFKLSIKKHPESFLYVDPPYAIEKYYYDNKNNELSKYWIVNKKMNGQGHYDLFNILSIRDDWCLSYNDCEFIRELYKGYPYVQPPIVTNKGYDGINTSHGITYELLIFSKNLSKNLDLFHKIL